MQSLVKKHGMAILLLVLAPFLATALTLWLEIIFKFGNIVGSFIRMF